VIGPAARYRRGVDEPALLQTGPETFRVLLGGGREIVAELPHHTRRGLGLTGVPPLMVAAEIVRFLDERDALVGPTVSLGAAAGRFPEFVEEITARLR
jgi:hypothetical protein